MAILLVDSYDSFTFNLKNLIESATGSKVYTIHNDSFGEDEYQVLDQFLKGFDAIIIGPGPGNPTAVEDVGIIPHLLKKDEIPILGICLGFQCLCDKYGADIKYLDEPVHGQVYEVETTGDDTLFKGMAKFNSVRYHSIHVELNDSSSDIVALAHTSSADGHTLMAAKHKTFPHYGVQYHPESICSEGGDLLVRNFWELVKEFNKTRKIEPVDVVHDVHVLRKSPLIDSPQGIADREILSRAVKLDITNLDICDSLHKEGNDFILLNSASFPGEWSIIAFPIEGHSDLITHSSQNAREVSISKWGSSHPANAIHLNSGESIWSFVANFIAPRSFRPVGEASNFPFTGGLVGLFSYEEGEFVQLDTLEPLTTDNVPDTKLCFIERFLLHNLNNNTYHVVSIIDDDIAWVESMAKRLESMSPISATGHASVKALLQDNEKIDVELPVKTDFIDSFNKCQDHLRKGDSYELCLTDTTKLKIPSRIDSWDIYKILTLRNPSPYSCYMSFDDCELLSSSPERFLSWNESFCELRPIKGTVKNTPEMDLVKATAILKTPKEAGENLMIVDLIRHDLYTFLRDIKVVQLMTVEEYKTVYQLVSVIRGSFDGSPYSGLDILSTSLPPGSMTGAPKKRSVELLQSIEKHKRRGIYSGVCGYLSLNNKSDWSVVIRSCYRYANDLQNDKDYDLWRIGAGGAITVLSDCEGEWQEMKLKLESALQAFK